MIIEGVAYLPLESALEAAFGQFARHLAVDPPVIPRRGIQDDLWDRGHGIPKRPKWCLCLFLFISHEFVFFVFICYHILPPWLPNVYCNVASLVYIKTSKNRDIPAIWSVQVKAPRSTEPAIGSS